jgi:glyoxylase-like metal-dependent hydrolase (beta-lactamase superfamily II)
MGGVTVSTLEPFEVYAIRYAHHDRRASENFIGGDPHDGPMPIDYFIWAITNKQRTFILDTGFDAEAAKRRNRTLLADPKASLNQLGISAENVKDVIISHMHYDHAGNHSLFPNARYHIQDREMNYCTGRCMCHHSLRHPFEVEDVVAMTRRIFAGQVQFHDGIDELAPGLTVHHVGGHTMGLQVVRVWTRRGWVVLASDASHFYRNMNEGRPFPIVYNVGDMLEAHQTLHKLASSPDHVIPGHDPLVLSRFPAASSALEGIVVRLDVEPQH